MILSVKTVLTADGDRTGVEKESFSNGERLSGVEISDSQEGL